MRVCALASNVGTVSQRGRNERRETCCQTCGAFGQLCAALEILCVLFMPRARLFKCVRSQRPSIGLYLRPVSHGVPRPPKTHWANDQPWQLKPISEPARHQEAHLLPALSHSHWSVRPLGWVTAPPACRAMVTGSKGTICRVSRGSTQNPFPLTRRFGALQRGLLSAVKKKGNGAENQFTGKLHISTRTLSCFHLLQPGSGTLESFKPHKRQPNFR